MKKRAAPSLNPETATTTALRSGGHRITILRRELVGILESSAQPLSPAELIAMLHTKRLAFNKTSIYRELQFLVAIGLAMEIDLRDGAKRYELRRGDHHHHHLICSRCGLITCAEVCFDQSPIVKAVKKRYGFEVTGHILDFQGICRACSEQ